MSGREEQVWGEWGCGDLIFVKYQKTIFIVSFLMKQIYHTDLQIRYKLGILDTDTAKRIPRSTLFYWRQKDYSDIMGKSFCDDENIVMIPF